ncbi:hypothetical protein RhiirC2_799166 [Rhizophagus irregularis]|uniref:Uncharacterized protein n=1 Tax=Rhizophagus irregularis TaxID=588596 RepID=A0A2N1M5C9_9GLOM|nr:hypothetical protein RhiirC2_799166 [Rhizophagus irregularis]
MNNHQEKIIVNNISDFEDFPIELLNPEFEQELSEIEPLREELNNDKDEEVSEIASFTSQGVATIFHVADWTDSNWAKYYKTRIISSLNINMSKMERHIWGKYGNYTNIAESAHALINREGKQLNLMSAILCEKRHDKKLLKIKNIQDDSGIPYTRCDKSEVKRQQINQIQEFHVKIPDGEIQKENFNNN